MRFDGRPALLCLAGLVLSGLACADFQRGPAPRDATPDGPDAGLVADATFEVEVYPILENHCGGCHASTGEGAYTALVLTGNARLDRAMVLALVVPGDPADSLLLRRASGESHTGGEVLSQDSADYASIASWISGLP